MRRPSKATVIQPETADKAVPPLAPALPRTEAPHIIHADGVYTVEDLRHVFGLKPSIGRREVRLGRLRIAKRCGRYYGLGQWVRQWIESGELKPRCERRDMSAGSVGPN